MTTVVDALGVMPLISSSRDPWSVFGCSGETVYPEWGETGSADANSKGERVWWKCTSECKKKNDSVWFAVWADTTYLACEIDVWDHTNPASTCTGPRATNESAAWAEPKTFFCTGGCRAAPRTLASNQYSPIVYTYTQVLDRWKRESEHALDVLYLNSSGKEWRFRLATSFWATLPHIHFILVSGFFQ